MKQAIDTEELSVLAPDILLPPPAQVLGKTSYISQVVETIKWEYM